MRLDDVVIHEDDAAKIEEVLGRFLAESGATEALLIDRGGHPLARSGTSTSLDVVSVAALAAGAFGSTGAMAQLLGETEFSVLFHEGVRQSINVSTVDASTILLAIFDGRTTVGMVRLFAKEANKAVAAILADARKRPKRTDELAEHLAGHELLHPFGRPAVSTER